MDYKDKKRRQYCYNEKNPGSNNCSSNVVHGGSTYIADDSATATLVIGRDAASQAGAVNVAYDSESGNVSVTYFVLTQATGGPQ